MKRCLVLRVFFGACLLSLSTTVLAELNIKSIAQVEKFVMTEAGEKVIQRQEATLVLPGEVIVYTITAINQGSEAAEDITLNNAISEHADYLLGSAGGDFDSNHSNITFSVDGGKNFNLPGLLVVQKDGLQRPAEASDYSNIRWILSSPLPAGESVKVWFKARLK